MNSLNVNGSGEIRVVRDDTLSDDGTGEAQTDRSTARMIRRVCGPQLRKNVAGQLGGIIDAERQHGADSTCASEN